MHGPIILSIRQDANGRRDIYIMSGLPLFEVQLDDVAVLGQVAKNESMYFYHFRPRLPLLVIAFHIISGSRPLC